MPLPIATPLFWHDICFNLPAWDRQHICIFETKDRQIASYNGILNIFLANKQSRLHVYDRLVHWFMMIQRNLGCIWIISSSLLRHGKPYAITTFTSSVFYAHTAVPLTSFCFFSRSRKRWYKAIISGFWIRAGNPNLLPPHIMDIQIWIQIIIWIYT